MQPRNRESCRILSAEQQVKHDLRISYAHRRLRTSRILHRTSPRASLEFWNFDFFALAENVAMMNNVVRRESPTETLLLAAGPLNKKMPLSVPRFLSFFFLSKTSLSTGLPRRYCILWTTATIILVDVQAPVTPRANMRASALTRCE